MGVEHPPLVPAQVDHQRRLPDRRARRSRAVRPLRSRRCICTSGRSWWSCDTNWAATPAVASPDSTRTGRERSASRAVSSSSAPSGAASSVACTLASSTETCVPTRARRLLTDALGRRSQLAHEVALDRVLQRAEAVVPELGREPHHRRGTDLRRCGEVGDGAEADGLRRGEDRFGDPAFGRRQLRALGPDAFGHLHGPRRYTAPSNRRALRCGDTGHMAMPPPPSRAFASDNAAGRAPGGDRGGAARKPRPRPRVRRRRAHPRVRATVLRAVRPGRRHLPHVQRHGRQRDGAHRARPPRRCRRSAPTGRTSTSTRRAPPSGWSAPS